MRGDGREMGKKEEKEKKMRGKNERKKEKKILGKNKRDKEKIWRSEWEE